MICFDNLSKRYPGGFEALKNVSFEMAAGEMAFLTGHSGAGKSTLLKMLMLMERPTSGNLLINGKNLNRLPNSQIPIYRRQVGVVFQNHQLLLDRTVFDNVALPLQVSGYPANEIGRRVRADWTVLVYSTKSSRNLLPCRAVSSSELASLAPWCTSRGFFWPMNQREISTPNCPAKLWRCSDDFKMLGSPY